MCFCEFQVGYFVGGVAPLESGEIAGIVGAFAIMASVLLGVIIVFLLKRRACHGNGRNGSGDGSRNPTVLSTIWIRKQGSNRPPETNNKNNNTANGTDHNKENGVGGGAPAGGVPATVIANGGQQVNSNSNSVLVNGTAYTKDTDNIEAFEIDSSACQAAVNPDIVPNGRSMSPRLPPASPYSRNDFRLSAFATLRRNSSSSERGAPEGGGDPHRPHHELHGYQNALCSPALTRKASSSPVHDVRKIIRPLSSTGGAASASSSPNVLPRSTLFNRQLGADALYPTSHVGGPAGYPPPPPPPNKASSSAYNLRDHPDNWESPRGYDGFYSPSHMGGYNRESPSPAGMSPRIGARGRHQSNSQTLPRHLPAANPTPHYANTQQLYSPYFQGGSPAVAAGIASSTGPTQHPLHPSASNTREYGYPSDYGLPLEPLQEDAGGELIASPHEPVGGGSLTLNPSVGGMGDGYFNPETGSDIMEPIHPHPLPHQQHLLQQQQQHNLNLSNSSAESSTLSPMRTSAGITMSSGIGDASTASGITIFWPLD